MQLDTLTIESLDNIWITMYRNRTLVELSVEKYLGAHPPTIELPNVFETKEVMDLLQSYKTQFFMEIAKPYLEKHMPSCKYREEVVKQIIGEWLWSRVILNYPEVFPPEDED